jgi:hypothetical protein
MKETCRYGFPARCYMGNGSGSPCAACDDPILPAQTEYEWDYPEDDQPRAFRMHRVASASGKRCAGSAASIRRFRLIFWTQALPPAPALAVPG